MKSNTLQSKIENYTGIGVGLVLATILLNQTFNNSSLAPVVKNSSSESKINASKNVKAFLATIRYAEGTSGTDGYKIMFTGKRFSSFAQHPKQIQCSFYAGKRLCSDAAGAYQFLSTTWEPLGLPDFSPTNQDKGAIKLIEKAGALELVNSGKFEEAIIKVSPIWASLPNSSGQSTYNQPVKAMKELRKIYESNLN